MNCSASGPLLPIVDLDTAEGAAFVDRTKVPVEAPDMGPYKRHATDVIFLKVASIVEI